MALSLNTSLMTNTPATSMATMKDLKLMMTAGQSPLTAVTHNLNNNFAQTGHHMGKTKGLSMLGMPLMSSPLSSMMMMPNPLLQMLSLKNELAKHQVLD